ncbi:unnamed protein product, partial [Candidula unifasciata]
SNSPWATWWAYQGLAGPQHWGYLNPDWVLCRSGKFQSPINIEPRLLLFDPKLRRMSVDVPELVSGVLKNTGNDIMLSLDDVMSNGANFSDGPFMYTYRLAQVKVHIGKTNGRGSEHRIDEKSFAAEIQLICYNSDLFKSLQEAERMPYGAAIIAVFGEIAEDFGITNSAFKFLVDMATQVPWQGQGTHIKDFRIKSLLPDTNYYVTYEGSFTQPGCQETVTWVLFNKPIYIDQTQIETLRNLQNKQIDNRMTMMEGNVRPTMPVNNRAIRTNINYPSTGGLCDMKRITFYE